jgi:hypothetical protein
LRRRGGDEKFFKNSFIFFGCIVLYQPEETARSRRAPGAPEFFLESGELVPKISATIIDGSKHIEGYNLCLYDPNDEKTDNDNGRVIAPPKCDAYPIDGGKITLELENFHSLEIIEENGRRIFNLNDPDDEERRGPHIKILATAIYEAGGKEQTYLYVRDDIRLGCIYKFGGKPTHYRAPLKSINKIDNIRVEKGQK